MMTTVFAVAEVVVRVFMFDSE